MAKHPYFSRPDDFLYHGTDLSHVAEIRKHGVLPKPHHPGETPVAWFAPAYIAIHYERGALAVIKPSIKIKDHHGLKYSLTPVRPLKILTGQELQDFKDLLGLKNKKETEEIEDVEYLN